MNDSVLFGKKSVTFWKANYLVVRCIMKRSPPMSGIIRCIIDISVWIPKLDSWPTEDILILRGFLSFAISNPVPKRRKSFLETSPRRNLSWDKQTFAWLFLTATVDVNYWQGGFLDTVFFPQKSNEYSFLQRRLEISGRTLTGSWYEMRDMTSSELKTYRRG